MEYLIHTPVASIIFLFTIVTSIYAFNDNGLYGKFMLHPYSVSRRYKVYTLITSGLIHADWMHLIFNMMTFFFFAFQLEAMIGSWQFGAVYFLSLILSDIPSVMKHKNDMWYNSLGASGAISGVLFSFILFQPFSSMMIFPIPIRIWAIIFGPLYLVYCVYASKNARDHINHDAHFFGALAGMIVTVLVVPGTIPHFIGQLLAKIG
ncbi:MULTISPECIES: rhomboid family intramembrane serine protease [Pedobacter]|uniref:Rhomboid family protein n=1 Tax=Pedobacter heparinus (strain ATCC 13125 / DSM 2366 / CIP 104194 / JCM 7457 / NBRC 12017 / NCIMB 9290 / NRRL B-14731 / HIM 762-3) TaxID=485917 RepID=C6XY58_PEDHD|nr:MULTISPECIES: rhomboid family intramembrane serine protease [Pedobacter]ACU02325.1 Rhomboid family protein [Pedobacter heparinus DSM 2366]MBB5437053.1 membrane associated rhomboid family serine protease [Pedobacter sp. AK017]